MIDTHLQSLSGTDDWPETLQESLALAKVLIQEGTHAAGATPHYSDEFVPCSAAEIQERVCELQRELDRHDIPLRIFAGHEALIQPGLVEDIQI
jgi:protein-tyrosine phosphatase